MTKKSSFDRIFPAPFVMICLALVGVAHAQSQKFQFAAIGDTSYSKVAEQEFDHLMAALNKENLAFVVHVHDFEADPNPYERNPDKITMPCTDENFQRVLAMFQKSANPFILTPGDNDWSDCNKLKARKFDPMERLARLREMFFPEGRSLGQRTMPVESQAKDADFQKYRENLMWSFNGVTFATVHTVGSNNNKGQSAETDAEHADRTKANIVWMWKNTPGMRIDGGWTSKRSPKHNAVNCSSCSLHVGQKTS